ncbi:MAG: T9SS type A sorting domain-containing protein [Bacteroidetes bacterium]|nr:T9SS type A sorting domain-containing protein [Bacteroidota bacterium]
MKKVLLFNFLIYCDYCLAQQNLVPNWSFEDTLNCGQTVYPQMVCSPWFNPTNSTPDYFTPYYLIPCGTQLNYPGVGYQVAKSGEAYCGLFCWEQNNQREYIEVALSDSLQAGKKYKISFWASTADAANYQVDKLGAALTKDSLFALGAGNINFIPQINSIGGILLTDTMNWFQINGEYIAAGGEKFITIGNFYDNSNTQVDSIYPNNVNFYAAYYFIDDVSVVEDTSLSINVIGLNKCDVRFELNDAFELNFESNCSIGKISMWSSDGKIVYQTDGKLSNSKIELHSKLAKGIYFAKIYYQNNTTQVSKIFIKH